MQDDDNNNNNDNNDSNSGGDAAVPDATIVQAIVGMGFSENAGKRAALATTNSGAEAATNWLFAHMEDPDLNDPLPATGGKGVLVLEGVVCWCCLLVLFVGRGCLLEGVVCWKEGC